MICYQSFVSFGDIPLLPQFLVGFFFLVLGFFVWLFVCLVGFGFLFWFVCLFLVSL